ncbi:GNAT family N-acetyltransferase [Novosphingobium sp. JCM 18896]|uniref:GNAT family N-acetyltransferase n=1 Tax=Novosphingobium sp. JCM 18896 TaxID=2989731 RepID=UPI00222162D3|nr:GNAT family N-acetyltransferase [Novosphingobium sp. JCM 18896]MCW1429024.1 GNAT family N-acetyltransferase [Novosphingobium sp. JCM 18896]
MIPEIETERLILRGPIAGDFPVYRDFFADAEASAAYGGPLRADRAWRVLATDLGHWALRGYGRWAVVEKASGRMIGGAGLWWPEGYPRSELTWWIVPTARRHGYAFEASRAAIAFGYNTLDWDLVETHMQDENAPARLLAEKLGGTMIARERFPDGITRNVYALPAG